MKKPLAERLLAHAARLETAIARTDELAIADALEAERALIIEAAERIRRLESPGIVARLRSAFAR